jgi:hypothetical protein
MLWRLSARRIPFTFQNVSSPRSFASASDRPAPAPVQWLTSWELEQFRKRAFEPQLPARLPRQTGTWIHAPHEWFIPRAHTQDDSPPAFSLKQDFWAKYSDVTVPLELTTDHKNGAVFQQMQAPLGVLLSWMEQATGESSPRLYLAQCKLTDLPQSLRDHVRTPEIAQKAGKGDIYDANLWMGLAPTYTPLHRDPNPNLFLQLAGRKVIRLFPPDVGLTIFAEVQEKLGRSASSAFRGEEMMQGPEKDLLEREVWERKEHSADGYEAVLDHGEALFIPLGWWHSIKGVGRGVTASVNWWFR